MEHYRDRRYSSERPSEKGLRLSSTRRVPLVQCPLRGHQCSRSPLSDQLDVRSIGRLVDWPRPGVFGDYELNKGRKDYPTNIAGAYHASRLPVLEYLDRNRRQAGAIVFLEVTREWVPLGVWRFRELARRALTGNPSRFTNIEDALGEARKRLLIPYRNWV